jgi:hypothetical protein
MLAGECTPDLIPNPCRLEPTNLETNRRRPSKQYCCSAACRNDAAPDAACTCNNAEAEKSVPPAPARYPRQRSPRYKLW